VWVALEELNVPGVHNPSLSANRGALRLGHKSASTAVRGFFPPDAALSAVKTHLDPQHIHELKQRPQSGVVGSRREKTPHSGWVRPKATCYLRFREPGSLSVRVDQMENLLDLRNRSPGTLIPLAKLRASHPLPA